MPIHPILTPIYDSHLESLLSSGRIVIRTRNPNRTKRMLSKRKWQRGLAPDTKLEYLVETANPETWETEDPDFLLTVIAKKAQEKAA